MMTNKIEDTLIAKYHDKTLASLYIARYNTQLINPIQWADDFIGQITKVADHPDILKIQKSEKESEYKVDSKSIDYFLKFIQYKPLQLEKKFIFLFDAHDISVILSNKLLKIFEELAPQYCLFLMVPDHSHMLATVQSRAIQFQISSDSDVHRPLESADMSKALTPAQLLDLFKLLGAPGTVEGTYTEKNFIEQLIQRTLSQCACNEESYNQLTELLKIISTNETLSTFNNSTLSRMTRFFS